MTIADCFRTLVPDMTPTDVAAMVGAPKEIADTTVPDGSGWGLQDALKYKIRAGEPVLQWTYFDDKHDHVVWFAKPANVWLMTLRLSLRRGLASDIHRE